MPTPETAAPASSPPRGRRVRPALLVPLVLLVAVVAAAAAIGLSVFVQPPREVDPVVLPVPTPTVPPVEREKGTAFQQALPDEVLAFAVAAQEEDLELRDAGAVEAYVLTYTDGAREVTLRAGQWPTAEGAVAVQEDLAGVDPASGEPVLVRGREVGRLVLLEEAEKGRALWTNGATLFTLRGPLGVVRVLYDAFPM